MFLCLVVKLWWEWEMCNFIFFIVTMNVYV